MNAPVKTVLFDAVGTLIYLPRTVGDHYREVGLRFGADLSAGELNLAFRRSWKAAPPRENTVGPRPDDDKGWGRVLVREVIRDVMPDTEWDAFPFEAYFEAVYLHFAEPGVWSLFPEAAGVLSVLQARGLKLGLVSNFDRRLRAILRHLDLDHFFAGIIISSEVGADKPDPLIFRRALSMLDADPAATVHVGDDPERDGGARALGLRVFELQRAETSLTDLLPWLEDSAG